MAVAAVIVGGGSSSRMRGTDKLTLQVNGMTVFEKSISAFCRHPRVDAVIAVARQDLIPLIGTWKEKYPKLIAVVPGGASRCLSVKAGLEACPADTEFVAIHDAARPFVSGELISSVLEAARTSGAAAPGLPVTDTVKRMNADGTVGETLDRSVMATVQTPQIFRFDAYRRAVEGADESFDDCQLYEKTGAPVVLVPGQKDNLKITTPEDLRRVKEMERSMPDLRVGHGYDVHRLTENRKLILGGVEIPYEKGLLGHSDADALLHALADALLGAAGLRDIGYWFPDNDPAFEGADSRVLLRRTVELIRERGYVPSSADVTVICQRPKLAPYIEQMRENIAADLGLEPGRIGIKATTEEKLGFTGEGLGISAHAVAVIVNT